MNLLFRISFALITFALFDMSAFADRKEALVTISGEVLYPGQYLCQGCKMTAQDLIDMAGGLTADAYLSGITIQRSLTDIEYANMVLACKLAEEQLFMLNAILQVPSRKDRYAVDVSVPLRSGDEVVVPKLHSTVKVSGAVQFPTVVTFEPEVSVQDYIRMAGGFSKDAARSRVYVLSPNGEKLKKTTLRLLPGSEILVPSRKNADMPHLFADEILSICTSTSSVTDMVLEMVERVMK